MYPTFLSLRVDFLHQQQKHFCFVFLPKYPVIFCLHCSWSTASTFSLSARESASKRLLSNKFAAQLLPNANPAFHCINEGQTIEMSHRKENGDGERIGLGEKKKIEKMNVERGEDGRKPKEKLAPSESAVASYIS